MQHAEELNQRVSELEEELAAVNKEADDLYKDRERIQS